MSAEVLHVADDPIKQGVAGCLDRFRRARADCDRQAERLLGEFDSLWDELFQFRQALANEKESWLRQRASEQERVNSDAADRGSREAEITQLREQLSEAQTRIEQLEGEVQSRQETLDQHAQQVVMLQGERTTVEQELEDVRARAGQLSDRLEASQREVEQERRRWNEEREQLRRSAQRHASQTGSKPAAESQAGDETAGADSDATGGRAEQMVVGSVLAQFEKLRNDRALRRSRLMEKNKDKKS